MKKLIILIVLFCVKPSLLKLHGQNNINNSESPKLYFRTEILADTINTFGVKKDSLFYRNRQKFAMLSNKWFSKQLNGLGEPIISEKYKNETYRFTWLRTFHNPISVRIEKRIDKYFLTLKRTNGAGGYEPGKLINNEEFQISDEEWNNIKMKIYNINFWKIPTIEMSNFIVADGAIWILEANKEKSYKMVYRNSASKSEVKEICKYLLKLSKLKIRKKKIY